MQQVEIDGYKIRIHPPVETDMPNPSGAPAEARIDGVPARICNGLMIDFLKEEFDRTVESECDPPFGLIDRALKSLLLRLRVVGHSHLKTQFNFPNCEWRLNYLNDDGTELPSTGGRLVGGRGTMRISFTWAAVNTDIWNDFNALSFDYEPPPWVLLLLDARAALPEVGPAIVLAQTALEVFVAHILNELAKRSDLPEDLWAFLNDRERRKDPSIGEQFDELLRILLGTSLKEDNLLWEGFSNLRDARNEFVHRGDARIGGTPVDGGKALELVDKAEAIVTFVRSRLPEDLQWPEYERSIRVEGSIPVLPQDGE